MLSEEEITKAIEHINNMTHIELASMWRFAPSGHIYFDKQYPQLYEAFKKRFDSFGGMTPEVSKEVGW
jgi:hypothetical protein